jgi:hypothetical protein
MQTTLEFNHWNLHTVAFHVVNRPTCKSVHLLFYPQPTSLIYRQAILRLTEDKQSIDCEKKFVSFSDLLVCWTGSTVHQRFVGTRCLHLHGNTDAQCVMLCGHTYIWRGDKHSTIYLSHWLRTRTVTQTPPHLGPPVLSTINCSVSGGTV